MWVVHSRIHVSICSTAWPLCSTCRRALKSPKSSEHAERKKRRQAKEDAAQDEDECFLQVQEQQSSNLLRPPSTSDTMSPNSVRRETQAGDVAQLQLNQFLKRRKRAMSAPDTKIVIECWMDFRMKPASKLKLQLLLANTLHWLEK